VRDEIRRIALFASGVGDLTRHRAEQIAKELVKSGEVRRDQAAGWAKTLFDASAANRQEIIRFIRTEMQHQVQALGLATTRDLDRLERRLDRVEASARRAVKTTAAKKTTVARAGATKTTVARAGATKTTAGKKTTGAKKTSARKSTRGAVPPRPRPGESGSGGTGTW
jgi:polyhydroxyalkanoate synthesis regulator phasin